MLNASGLYRFYAKRLEKMGKKGQPRRGRPRKVAEE